MLVNNYFLNYAWNTPAYKVSSHFDKKPGSLIYLKLIFQENQLKIALVL